MIDNDEDSYYDNTPAGTSVACLNHVSALMCETVGNTTINEFVPAVTCDPYTNASGPEYLTCPSASSPQNGSESFSVAVTVRPITESNDVTLGRCIMMFATFPLYFAPAGVNTSIVSASSIYDDYNFVCSADGYESVCRNVTDCNINHNFNDVCIVPESVVCGARSTCEFEYTAAAKAECIDGNECTDDFCYSSGVSSTNFTCEHRVRTGFACSLGVCDGSGTCVPE